MLTSIKRLGAAGLALVSVAAHAETPALGRLAWMQCQACHTLKPGEPNKVGPNLSGVIGARAASKDGFTYSNALKTSAITWDEPTLDRFIARPSAVVKGSRMMFAGISDGAKRRALIRYMQSEGAKSK